MNSTTHKPSTVSYTKLRSGDWGVKGPEDLIRAAIDNDATVAVAKRDGATKDVRPHSIVWAGNGVAIATVFDAQERARKARHNHRAECSECGEYGPAGRQCTNCYEGSFA